MDTLQLSKIAGAVLAAILLLVGTATIAKFIQGDGTTSDAGTPVAGYTLESDDDDDGEDTAKAAPAEAAPAAKAEPTTAAAAPAAPAAPTAAPATPAAPAVAATTETPASADGSSAIIALVSKYTAADGEKPFKKCKGCHNAAEGAGKKAGPNLWGIVGRPKGSVEGFPYSAAMKRKGGDWTLEDLASFMKKPKSFVVGTKMFFKGFKKDKDVAKLLAYLASLK